MKSYDFQLLRDIEILLMDRGAVGQKLDLHFTRVDFGLIVPFGNSLAYSANSDDQVTGIKMSHLGKNANIIVELVCKMASLRRLVINHFPSFEVPESIAGLNLKFLWLNGSINRIPEEVFKRDLPVYVEEGRPLSNLSPDAYKFISRLNSSAVDVSNSEIHENQAEKVVLSELELSASLDYMLHKDELNNIEGIFFGDGISLSDPPLEIASKGVPSLMRYFIAREKDGLPLNEIKLILVGNGGSGKTSLVKRIFGEKFDPKERQTHGINIKKTAMPSGGAGVKMHYWDFGGQEIMHATHQFFLSKRSAYILVLDGRKEEDPEYWLQHIESFGGDSPIFVVLNKIDEHASFDVNRRFLSAKYSGIVGYYRVSCLKDEGIGELIKSLLSIIPAVPMLQTRWPMSWFQVKNSLENRKNSYISLLDYKNVCEKEKINDEESQELLIDFLHDLGVVLRFKDIQLLDTHVLDPRWVTEGVYRIINSKTLAHGQGTLRLNDLDKILKRRGGQTFEYPREKHSFLIDLMLKFELCYKLDENNILIPDLLDIQEPPLPLPDEAGIHFIFEYAYLPRSVMPRLIVRLHDDIEDGKCWRSGVLLSDGDTKSTALVRADYKARKIFVDVWGERSRDYFSIIRKTIKKINASFEKMDVVEYIPIPGHADILLEYQELVGHEISGREKIFVGKIRKELNVSTLLNGVESPDERGYSVNFQIGDNYFSSVNGSSVQDLSINNAKDVAVSAQKNNVERLIVILSLVAFLFLIGFLLIRNEPFADGNLVVVLRIMVSLIAAVFGATIPGMLHIEMNIKGVIIRAAGALGLFVMAFMFTPHVMPQNTAEPSEHRSQDAS